MKRTVSALDSNYVIDGVQMDSTPGQMLEDCVPVGNRAEGGTESARQEAIVDETVDPVPGVTKYDPARVEQYVEAVSALPESRKKENSLYPASYTKRKIAEALIGALWRKGHFSLEDIELRLSWLWDSSPLGNMAAFYRSVEAAAQYIFDLSVRLRAYEFVDTERATILNISVSADGRSENENEEDEYNFLTEEVSEKKLNYCWISDELKCPAKADDSRQDDWLIYIPFDTCDFRLGDSLLEKAAGSCGDSAPEISDPDYFMDCFEIVRELVEDGVVAAAHTVSEGGLACAISDMCSDIGTSIDISAIESAYSEKNIIRILFGETPGVLIQIRDEDYDYVDSQMLLQDIAYYPLGHPGQGGGAVEKGGAGTSARARGLKVVYGKKPGVSDILASLIQGQASEGED